MGSRSGCGLDVCQISLTFGFGAEVNRAKHGLIQAGRKKGSDLCYAMAFTGTLPALREGGLQTSKVKSLWAYIYIIVVKAQFDIFECEVLPVRNIGDGKIPYDDTRPETVFPRDNLNFIVLDWGVLTEIIVT